VKVHRQAGRQVHPPVGLPHHASVLSSVRLRLHGCGVDSRATVATGRRRSQCSSIYVHVQHGVRLRPVAV